MRRPNQAGISIVSMVAAAAEHADIAILPDGSLELDANQRVLGKGPADFVMRDFDEIGLGEHTHHFLAEPAVGRLEIRLRSAGVRIDLRVEVKYASRSRSSCWKY